MTYQYYKKGGIALRFPLSLLNQTCTGLLVLLISSFWLLLVGCTSNKPGLPISYTPDVNTLQLKGLDFVLAAAERPAKGNRATVFIEGDGQPWIAGGRILADDPTPRNTPMLSRLLHPTRSASVTGPMLYLGRPCYFGMGPAERCHPALWSFSRYSTRVVSAMSDGLRMWLKHQGRSMNITLVGHSGGGVLALLIAEEVAEVDSVITYAAPIDVDLWSQLHDFTPLFDSLNPARINTWRPEVQRTLVFGSEDTRVPANLFIKAADGIPSANYEVMAADHLPPPDFPDRWRHN